MDCLKAKRASRKARTKLIIVYTLVGTFFFAILLGFYLGIANISADHSENTEHGDVITVLSEKGFETANIPTTFWSYDENKLANVCAGVKDDTRFEFYEYTDSETTDLVYKSIVIDITQDMEPSERAEHETELLDSSKMAKRQSKLVQGILLAVGIIFICGAVYFFVHGINTYIQQFDQKDWKVTTATVINVDERRKSSGGRHTTHHTVYDIYYQYEAEGNIYTDAIYGVNTGMKYGETFDIKYNPEAPQNSTHYLEPTWGFVISGVFGCIVFGTIGLYMVRNALFKGYVS